ncbi:hypothetical protein [Guptibacillus hwajinpoensis]|uniref:hypothetical protein n=1 Tax=Guptibacillus hwajinpoensis TaxID=208199 RepID=UPI001CFCDBEF|nr:hypothetical protein [Pseudalkalibacillus hwajinpoensis]WLR59304.1 hypothetical protein LC071_19535 [Pseudalkalibacillus hwajinpoensis]
MNIIKRKTDVETLLKDFEQIAEFDQIGQKHYLVFDDTEKEGQCTVMKYQDASFSVHCKGASYCDDQEKYLDARALIGFLWKRRKAINTILREVLKEKVS